MKNKKTQELTADGRIINKTTTLTVDDIRRECQKIGDSLKTTYDLTGDIKAAQSAVSAYATAINAVKAQLIYKKLTGSPGKINFFESQNP